jgi:hypothetical protein
MNTQLKIYKNGEGAGKQGGRRGGKVVVRRKQFRCTRKQKFNMSCD